MRLSRFCSAVATTLLWSIGSWAQTNPNLETGFKPYGSYHGNEVDTVNVMNGNPMLHIPFPQDYVQRGGKLGKADFLSMHGKGWQVQLFSGEGGASQKWMPNRSSMGPVDWLHPVHTRLLSRITTAGVTNEFVQQDVLVAADGSNHQLMDVSNGKQTAFEAVDGSGWRVNLSSPDQYGVPQAGVMLDRDGVQYTIGQYGVAGGSCLPTLGGGIGGGGHAPLQTMGGGVIPTGSLADCSEGSQITTATDANGNVFSLPANNTWTDTMGRAAPFGFATTLNTSGNPPGAGCPASPLTYYGYGTASYPAANGGTNQILLCFGTMTFQTNFGVSGILEYPATEWPGVLTSMVLPDDSAWTFNYDSYANLTSIGLPLGGTISYQWATVAFPPVGLGSAAVSRAVTQRTLTDNNGHSYTWKYQWMVAQSNPTNSNGTYTNVVTDPLGNDTVHVFTNLLGGFYETRTQTYQGSYTSGALLQQVDTAYQTYSPGDSNDSGTTALPSSIQTTVYPSGKVKLVQKTYDAALTDATSGTTSYGKVLTEKEYDWGQGSPGALLRETDTSYEWQVNSAYLTANLLDLPASVIIKDGSGNKLAETDYTYDESQSLSTSNISTQHGAPPNSVRGNLTTVSKWLNTGGSVVTHTNWYDSGEVFQQLDALQHATTHSYDPAYVGAYSTRTCNALSQCVSGTYDFNTGVLTSFTNANATQQASGNTPGDSAHTTTYSYDLMSRLTTAVFPPDPSNNGAQAQTTFQYPNPISLPFTVTKTHSVTPTLTDSVTSTYDGLGRVYKTQHPLPNGTAEVDTTYDALDHVLSVTNPYFSTSDPTYGEIQTQYDALGRATQTTKQDGSIISAAYDVAPPSGVTGNCTVSTDEAGRSRRACSDGLGRLVEVDEPRDPIVNFNGEAAPATAVYSMTGFPDSYGEHDLYVGTDGHVYQLYLSPSGWVNQDLTAMTSGETATAHSAMTSFVDSFGDHVLYVGTNQHIYQMYFSVGAWQNQDLSSQNGNTLAATGTGLSSFADGSGEHVLYIGTNQHVLRAAVQQWNGMAERGFDLANGQHVVGSQQHRV